MGQNAIGLVAFDLDGTLLHGDTVLEATARQLGRLERVGEFESLTHLEDIEEARKEVASWYSPFRFSELCSSLTSLQPAPGVSEGFQLLKQYGVKVAIISITWEFAVEWFASRLGADYYVGTRLSPAGQISHFWPQDKPRWLAKLAQQLGVGIKQVAAVGDSASDMDMLRIVGHPFFVGQVKPDELEGTYHFPKGDILEIAQNITSASRR